MTTVDSTSDARTINNVMRHGYRVLSDDEKAQMQAVVDTLNATRPEEPQQGALL